jgi:hypothetical protein
MGRSWLSMGLLVAGLSLQVAAIGCGDDDDSDVTTVAGTGGKSGGGGGGKSGSSAAGKGAGGSVSPDQCVAKTKTSAPALGTACTECGCDADAKSFAACSDDANCWKLVMCLSQACDSSLPEAMYNACAGGALGGDCKPFAAGLSAARTAGPILMGACKSQCIPSDGDAGTEDAGNN